MVRLMRALEVIKAGQQVANPAAWKNATVWTNLVAALFMLAQAFGVGAEFSNVHYEAIGIIVVMVLNILVYLFNIYSTYASSKKVGL
jgi:uncharacterized membrane protein YuzA (DUF378 family)